MTTALQQETRKKVGVRFNPGERATCPARIPRVQGSVRCGGTLDLFAGPRTSITIRVVALLKIQPGEAVQFCRRCRAMLAVTLEAVA